MKPLHIRAAVLMVFLTLAGCGQKPAPGPAFPVRSPEVIEAEKAIRAAHASYDLEGIDPVFKIKFPTDSPTDASLATLRPVLEATGCPIYLDITGNPGGLTEAGIASLKGMKNLRGLRLIQTMSPSILRDLAEIPDLEELYLGNQEYKDADVTPLAKLTKLRDLYCATHSLSPASLAIVRNMTELRKFSVSFKKNDAALENLKGLTKLEELYLSDDVSDAGVAHLKNLTSLRMLHVTNCPKLTDAGLANFEHMTKLQSVYLSSTGIKGAGLKHFAAARELRDLHMDSHFGEEAYQAIAGLTSLEKLGAYHGATDDACLKHLANLTNLKVLELGETRITGSGFAHLKNLTALQELSAGSTQVTDAAIPHLKALTGLKKLAIYQTGVTDAGLEQLAAMPALEDLSLGHMKISDAGLAHLSKLPQLRELALDDDIKVTDAAVPHFLKMTNLTSLRVRGTRITSAGVATLKKERPNLMVFD